MNAYRAKGFSRSDVIDLIFNGKRVNVDRSGTGKRVSICLHLNAASDYRCRAVANNDFFASRATLLYFARKAVNKAREQRLANIA